MQARASAPGMGNLGHLQHSIVGADAAHEQWVLRNFSQICEEAGDALLPQLPCQLGCAGLGCACRGSFVSTSTLTVSSETPLAADQDTNALLLSKLSQRDCLCMVCKSVSDRSLKRATKSIRGRNADH